MEEKTTTDLSDFEKELVRYEGMFRNSQRYGLGYLRFKDGSFFLGEFLGDKANGIGVFVNKDGQHFSGFWKDNVYMEKQASYK